MSVRLLLLAALGLTSLFSSACATEGDHDQQAQVAFELLAEAINSKAT